MIYLEFFQIVRGNQLVDDVVTFASAKDALNIEFR